MNALAFDRLRALRMENDAAGLAMEEMRPRFDTLAGRHENGTAPRAVTAYQLFQTPPEVAKRLVALLDMKPGMRVLEPSAGLGNLLDAIKPHNPFEVVAVEISASCAGELYRQNREGVVIKQRDFLTLTADDLGLFDAVVMNPPFHMRSDIKHIQHAITMLKPGCKLAAICMAGGKRDEVLKPMADTWIELESGTFGKTGTDVRTVMLTITRPWKTPKE